MTLIRPTRGQLDDAIRLSEELGSPGHATLFAAARAGQISVMIVPRNAPVTDAMLTGARRPLVALLSDDDQFASGPSGFRSWPKLRAWARYAMIHAARSSGETYRIAVLMTALQGGMLLVETNSACEPEWTAALEAAGIPAICVVPRDEPHPTADRTPGGGS
jgi:hypothetical protein